MQHGDRPDGSLNTLPLGSLYAHLAQSGLVRRLLELAHEEDLGAPARGSEVPAASGDVTTWACIPAWKQGVGQVVARKGGVVAGLAVVPEMMRLFAPGCSFDAQASDGDEVGHEAVLGVLRGPLDEILELERTLLNLLGRLGGVATLTRTYARAIPAGARARLFDTRKTTPGLRVLEKYAVRCGGGYCHRIGLHDAMLIKDNHLAGVGVEALAAFVHEAVMRARRERTLAFVEVEVDTLEQLTALLTLPAGVIDMVLLDNMNAARLRQAVAMRDRAGSAIELECSGGVTLATLPELAGTGVDRISVGALTHSAVSLDVALDVTEVAG